jgi:hypothetical protein
MYVLKMQSEQISNTVEFFPTGANRPILKPANAAIAMPEALCATIKSNKPMS